MLYVVALSTWLSGSTAGDWVPRCEELLVVWCRRSIGRVYGCKDVKPIPCSPPWAGKGNDSALRIEIRGNSNHSAAFGGIIYDRPPKCPACAARRKQPVDRPSHGGSWKSKPAAKNRVVRDAFSPSLRAFKIGKYPCLSGVPQNHFSPHTGNNVNTWPEMDGGG